MLVALLALSSACSVGQGSGFVRGEVVDRRCELELSDWSLNPSFYAADFIEDTFDPDGSRRRVSIRIQRGSFRDGDSDGITIQIADVNEIERQLVAQREAGVETPEVRLPIERASGAQVQMILYLAETCVSGPPNGYFRVPFALEANSGEIVITDVFAPDVDPGDSRFAFRFENTLFESDFDPEGRRALIEGEATFFFQRGRPAQGFP